MIDRVTVSSFFDLSATLVNLYRYILPQEHGLVNCSGPVLLSRNTFQMVVRFTSNNAVQEGKQTTVLVSLPQLRSGSDTSMSPESLLSSIARFVLNADWRL